jgi:predicted nucleic acid-binding protein
MPASIELDRLLAGDEVATTDIVIAEILQGARTQSVFDDWLRILDALHYLPATREIWVKAAGLSFQLMRQGQTTPLSDLVVAQVALANDAPVFATDTDFERVHELQHHRF